jgi:hypothetical protein
VLDPQIGILTGDREYIFDWPIKVLIFMQERIVK